MRYLIYWCRVKLANILFWLFCKIDPDTTVLLVYEKNDLDDDEEFVLID